MNESETLLEWVRKNRKSDLMIRSDASNIERKVEKLRLTKLPQYQKPDHDRGSSLPHF